MLWLNILHDKLRIPVQGIRSEHSSIETKKESAVANRLDIDLEAKRIQIEVKTQLLIWRLNAPSHCAAETPSHFVAVTYFLILWVRQPSHFTADTHLHFTIETYLLILRSDLLAYFIAETHTLILQLRYICLFCNWDKLKVRWDVA